MLPEGVKSVFDLPPAESNLIAVEAALKSGWFTDPPDGDDWPGEMTYNELDALAVEVWTAWKDATVIDPKS